MIRLEQRSETLLVKVVHPENMHVTNTIVPTALQLQQKADKHVTQCQQQTLHPSSRDAGLCGQSHSLSPMDAWTEASDVHASAYAD